ncbi:50S ribosomal protein L23 [Candidatus Roizmanbacteria bacterium]|nr:50S ribosomal protein L23 [Candidatus Roizmanbacteria bacterium]
MKINEVILRPVVTEKATNLAATGVYMFMVHPDATKHKIKAVLEHLYKVKTGAVKILVRKGKVRRVGKRRQPKTQPNTKIAYVKITEGKLDLIPQA